MRLTVAIPNGANGTTRPANTDRVVVHYTGWTADGQIFDSTLVRGEPYHK